MPTRPPKGKRAAGPFFIRPSPSWGNVEGRSIRTDASQPRQLPANNWAVRKCSDDVALKFPQPERLTHERAIRDLAVTLDPSDVGMPTASVGGKHHASTGLIPAALASIRC